MKLYEMKVPDSVYSPAVALYPTACGLLPGFLYLAAVV